MDVTYVNPFVRSIKRVFDTMLRVKVSVGKPTLRHGADSTAEVSDVSAVIGFTGDAVGTVVLSFPMDAACAAATRFAGMEIDEHHADFADALGELANMVAGCAKTEMEGLSVSISLPSVITGAGHRVSQSRVSPRIVIPCQCELGPVFVEIGMEVGKTSTTAKLAASGVNS
ncbi:MAG: chemotaxis protein CheX [bacterium]|nr:chemotaxis protein CheX [bacterium]